MFLVAIYAFSMWTSHIRDNRFPALSLTCWCLRRFTHLTSNMFCWFCVSFVWTAKAEGTQLQEVSYACLAQLKCQGRSFWMWWEMMFFDASKEVKISRNIHETQFSGNKSHATKNTANTLSIFLFFVIQGRKEDAGVHYVSAALFSFILLCEWWFFCKRECGCMHVINSIRFILLETPHVACVLLVIHIVRSRLGKFDVR